MTKREQRRFVRDLLMNIQRDIRDAIRTNGIPRSWNGIELREYIAEKADRARATHALVGHGRGTIATSSRSARAYEKTLLERNRP
jgi:hypothetical protein